MQIGVAAGEKREFALTHFSKDPISVFEREREKTDPHGPWAESIFPLLRKLPYSNTLKVFSPATTCLKA